LSVRPEGTGVRYPLEEWMGPFVRCYQASGLTLPSHSNRAR